VLNFNDPEREKKEEGNLKFNSITFLRGVCTIKLRASVTVEHRLLKHAGWCRRIHDTRLHKSDRVKAKSR
jgi:hypothetical protein